VAVHHLVIMKLRQELPGPQLATLYRECEADFAKIPGVLSASMGANFRPSSSEFTHALVIRFADRNALEGFMIHPRHIATGRRMQTLFSDFLIFDYESERD
jgi:hypothetical protein